MSPPRWNGFLATGILANLRCGRKAFGLGREYVNDCLTRAKARALARQYAREKEAAARANDDAAREVAQQATRSPLTTPAYKITKAWAKPLPGSYASKQ